MRGMEKWKPFNAILNDNDIKDVLEKRKQVSKPIIMEDRIIEINETLKLSLDNYKNVNVKYYNKGYLKEVTGMVSKANIIEKYILIDSTRIYFKNIIKIYIID